MIFCLYNFLILYSNIDAYLEFFFFLFCFAYTLTPTSLKSFICLLLAQVIRIDKIQADWWVRI